MPRLPKDGPAGGAWQWSRTAQTQRALLDAARQVFTERGFAEASIADIVQRAGSSVGSLYHHFGGKSELFIALWQEHQLAHEEAASQAVADARKQGVAGTPTMLVIIRGPSSSSTTAIAYGASSSKPGAGRWLIT